MSTRSNKNHIKKGFFVAGTDTGVGKTLVACGLLKKIADEGNKVIGLKPVASGCFFKQGKLYSEDALSLYKCSNKKLSYSAVNPFAFEEPIAPHIAARNNKVDLSVSEIIAKSDEALTCDAEYIIIEGAGGWLTPINNNETMADLAKAYGYPVILVVGIRLGCINHAVLTYNNMKNSGIKIAGWIANVIDDDMIYVEENINAIDSRLNSSMIGVIKHDKNICFKNLSNFIRLDVII